MDVRIVNIINVLFEANDYISSIVIAEKVGISESTLFRLLPQVEKYVASYNLSFFKLRGKGFMLTGNKEAKKHLIADFAKKNYRPEFSPAEKGFLVFLYLLNEKETVKIALLANELHISETSLSKILSELENRLIGADCMILRRRGFGTCIGGNEIAVRLAALNAACLYLNFNEFMSFLYAYIHKPAEEQHILKLYSLTCAVFEYLNAKTNIAQNFAFVEKIEQLTNISFSDIDFVLMFLYVSITELRCKNDFFIQSYTNEHINTKNEVFEKIAQAACELEFFKPEAQCYENEIRLLMEVFQSTEAVNNALPNQKEYEQTAANFITFIEGALDGRVLEHKKIEYLIYLQILHLIKKHRGLFSIRQNTAFLAENIINKNNGMQSILKRSAEYLQKHLHIPISDEDSAVILGFISPFFEHNTHKIAAGLVCASGIVISSILKEKISKNFPELDPIETISIRKLTDTHIKEQNIDFIISFIETPQLSVPVAHVSVQMEDSDIEQIKQIIQNIRKGETHAC
ncbi:helix-turn-helix domain-containing protein [Treponema sp. OMZ 840]|uniref:BglG family transcription antiterminator n=1 Tax=Treponema sp. OMZ 840 TaxID=244313 RepID=UPI003D8F461D